MFDRISATLPTGAESLLFWQLQGDEIVSRSFTFSLSLLSTEARIDRSTLLGKPVTINIPTQNLQNPTRYLNGKVTGIRVNSADVNGARYVHYQLEVESDLWPLKRDRNQRIFQNQRVPDIVASVLRDYGVNLEDRLTGSYRVWEYCVQYQESSYDFISRLMELEGIYYFFEHSADKHTLVLVDAPATHKTFTGYETIAYHATPSGGSTSEQGIGQWAISERVTPGLYSTDDYDFRKPYAWMLQARQNPVSPQPGNIDYYEWPGHFVDHSHAEHYAQVRQEEWQAEHQRVDATATALGVVPGCTFELTTPPFASDAGNYLVMSARYQFQENSYSSGNAESVHRIDFVVIPAATQFRPAQRTPWPRTHGPQTARVMGPEGQSIWTDQYGRVKVKFHWDRLGKEDDTSSCWVRVSSAWAGQGFGGIQIPRVQDEVVVDFVNGDPDRPIITGRVYNDAKMPPWALPAAATQMGFLSRSKDGTPENANALRFEDKKGEEQLWVQAERDMDVNIKQNSSRGVGGNESHYVAGDALWRIASNRNEAVQGNDTHLTGGNRIDESVGVHVIGSSAGLRLQCGDSVLEMTPDGTFNLYGKAFNLRVDGNGNITTNGGELKINGDSPPEPPKVPGESAHKASNEQAVKDLFPSDEE